jgi:RHS repeat-associated protein
VAPFPSSVYFQCDSSTTPYVIAYPPGFCRVDDNTYKPPCNCNGGAASPTTPYPINLITGAKRFFDMDFESADGALVVNRTFVSIPFGQLRSFVAHRNAFANWSSNLDVEINLGGSWTSDRIVAILNGDGTAENFIRQSDGSLKPYSDNAVADTDSRLTFVGAWPANLSTVTSAATQWQLVDRDNNIWTLQTLLNAGSGKYDIGRPIQVKRPDGTVLTFAYGADTGISTITDQTGKSISLTWNHKLVYSGATGTNYATNISSITLPGGYKINYTYENPFGTAAGSNGVFRLKKVEYLDGAGIVQDSKSYQYTSSLFPFFVTAVLDSTGAVRWQAAYDNRGRATSSQGPNGEFATTVTYSVEPDNSEHRYLTFSRTQTDPFGRQTTYNFSHINSTWSTKLTSVQKAATTHNVAATTSNTYGTDNFIATTTDEEGRVTKYTRNTLGQPTQIIEAYGTSNARTTNYTWSSSFNLPTQIAETGLTTNITYDTQGRISTYSLVDTTSQSVPYSTNGQTRTWTYTYGTTAGATGKLVSIDGPLSGTGDTKTFTYNANGYLASITDEVGKVTTVTAWDWRGAPLTVVDPNSISTTFTYDVHGRPLTTTINPGASQSQFTYGYDVVGNLSQITLPTGGYLLYTYDAASRLTQVKNDKNETVTLTPNTVGDPTLEVTKNASATITAQMATVYDEVGSTIQVLGAASTTPTGLSYDKVANLKTVTDGRGKTTTNTFDALNRVTQVSNPESQTVKYAYNAQDAVTSHKDGRNLETTFVANGFGDAIQEVSPDRGTRTYWYDLAGRMTKLVDGDGEETDFSYDNAGRLLTKTFPGASGETVTYTYDSTASGNKGNGRLTSVTEQSGATAFTYDALGRVITDAKTIQGLNYTVSYAYNANGDITQETLPSGRVVTFTRDNDGLITGITTKPSATGTVSTIASSMTYQPFGPLKGLTYGNGLTLARTYNTNSWLTQIQVKDGVTGLLDLGYQYYDDGRLGEIDDNIATGRTTYISLTDSGRLSYAAGPWGQESYAWDAAGNRTGNYLTVGGTTTTTNSITAGNSNRVTLTNDQNATTKRTLQYRTGGDLYSDATAGGSTYTYSYNARKRLVQIDLNGVQSATYGYDFQEHRVWRTVSSGGSSTDIHYIFDQDGHLLAEHNGYTGALLREYIWADDMPVAVIDSSSGTAVTYYIHTGHLDEPQVMTNAAKAKVWDAYVTPFGSAKVFTTATANTDLRLPGQWYQAEAAGSGLNQNGYRDYDPTLGRYIEADPLGLGGGQNPYAYVDGRVYDMVDPRGLWGFGVAGGVSGEGGLGAGIGATGSIGAGIFGDRNGHLSTGGFASGGAFAGMFGTGYRTPAAPGPNVWAAGAYAGGGLGIWGTNAENVCDLLGPFKTWSFNAGYGIKNINIQVSYGYNAAGRPIVFINYGGPLPLVTIPTGAGLGISVSQMNTNTIKLF